MIFSRVYDFVISFQAHLFFCRNDLDYSLFDKDMVVYEDAFNVCYFMSLCQFLYESRRIKGESLRKFIYDHSARKYNEKGSPYYFNYSEKNREFIESNSDKPANSSNSILKDEAKLRQYRKRLLETRPVYHDSSEWSAIRKVSEHEWKLYFALVNTDAALKDTEKRIRNLYNEMREALKPSMDSGHSEKIKIAFKKFDSKLRKIQYEKFLSLGSFFLKHISEDKSFYGINLYRFEKEIKLYRVTSDVNHLLNCADNKEKERIMDNAHYMEYIAFTKLYEYFGDMPDIKHTKVYASTFGAFMDEVVKASRLVIDKFVEDGTLGEDWLQLFINTTNELAEVVLYDPSKIDYSLSSGSQEIFWEYLQNPVIRWIELAKEELPPC